MANPFESTDGSAVLDRVLDNLQVAMAENQAVVKRSPLPTVQADAVQLRQLLQHLIENAIKFRRDRAPRICVDVTRADGEWLFSVGDNGIGIAPDYAERVFGVFERLHSHTDYSGTGIGLAICRRIVERHGGRIWVESEPEKGATFCFTLPDRGDQAS